MDDNFKTYKKLEGKLKSVEWFDANSRELDVDVIENAGPNGEGLLALNTTYGKILKVFKSVIVIITEETTINTEKNITTIPLGWVTRIY